MALGVMAHSGDRSATGPRQMIRAAKRLCLREMATWLAALKYWQREYHRPWPQIRTAAGFGRNESIRPSAQQVVLFDGSRMSLGSYSAPFGLGGVVFSRMAEPVCFRGAWQGRVVSALAAAICRKADRFGFGVAGNSDTPSRKDDSPNFVGGAAIAASVRSTSPHRACSLFPHLLSANAQRSCR